MHTWKAPHECRQGPYLVGNAELGEGGDELGSGRVDVDGLKAVGLADAVVAQIQRSAQAALCLRMHIFQVRLLGRSCADASAHQ